MKRIDSRAGSFTIYLVGFSLKRNDFSSTNCMILILIPGDLHCHFVCNALNLIARSEFIQWSEPTKTYGSRLFLSRKLWRTTRTCKSAWKKKTRSSKGRRFCAHSRVLQYLSVLKRIDFRTQQNQPRLVESNTV